MRTSASPLDKTTRRIFAKTRMEAFSDGVFAVAITLLVVDIAAKIPPLSPAIEPDFKEDWWTEFWPKGLTFVYSFFVVGVYWAVHHNEMHLIKGTTRAFNWLNLVFLLFIVLIPFSAALLGTNWRLCETIDADRFLYMRIPIFTYSTNLILAGISLQVLWWYAKRQSILSDHVSDSDIRQTFNRNWLIPGSTLVVLIVTLWSVKAGQRIIVGIPLLYAVWTLREAYKIRKKREGNPTTTIGFDIPAAVLAASGFLVAISVDTECRPKEQPPESAAKEQPSVPAAKEQPPVPATKEQPSVPAAKEQPPGPAAKQATKFGPNLYTISTTFSPDDKQPLIFLGSPHDSTVRLWDVANGKELRVFEGHTSMVNAVVFSSDGKQALTGANDQTIRLWDVASGRELGILEGNAPVTSVALSPDGKQALNGGSFDGVARLWDVASRTQIGILKGVGDTVFSVAFSPDGKQALTGTNATAARLWDVASKKELRILRGHKESVRSVAFSPDGKQALTGSADDTAILWDLASGKALRVLKGHGHWVMSVAFSPDGKQALTGSYDHTARLWDLASGKELSVFR